MDWDNLKVFLAVARAGSVAEAAEYLHLDQSTVSRRLRRLEEDIGAKLFKTEGGNKTLTQFGISALAHAQRAEAAIYDSLADAKLSQSVPNGKVIISASSNIIRHALIPRIKYLRDEHANLEVQFDVSHDLADLSRMAADIAIRLQRPKTRDYAQQKIGKLSYSVYQSTHVQGAVDWIGFSGRLADISEVKSVETALPKKAPLLRTNDPSLSLEAIRTGLVFGILPSFVAAKFDDITPIDQAQIIQRDVWLVTRMDMKDVPEIVATKDWLRKCISEIADSDSRL